VNRTAIAQTAGNNNVSAECDGILQRKYQRKKNAISSHGNSGGAESAITNEQGVQSSEESIIPRSVYETLNSRGQNLPGNAKRFMEPRFQRSFDDIRIHTDASAADSAKEVNALAYTAGNHIVFGSSNYSLNSNAGQHLLAHELVHTIQQRNTYDFDNELRLGSPNTRFESQANIVAGNVLKGRTLSVSEGVSEPMIQRQDQFVDIELEPVSPEEATALRQRGIDLPEVSPETYAASNSVRSVSISCSDNTIIFYTTAGTHTYNLNNCDMSNGEYIASVAIENNEVTFDLGEVTTPGLRFDFGFDIEPGQPNPTTFFQNQSTVRIVANSGGHSLNNLLADQPGNPTLTSLTASATLPTGHILSSDSERTIRTLANTRVNARASRSRITLSFDPELVITRHGTLDVDVNISQLYWDFGTQEIGISSTARGGVYLLSYVTSGQSPGQAVLAQLNSAISSNVPSRVFARGYNPFTDQDLPGDLAHLAQSVTSVAAGTSNAGPATSNVRLSAGFSSSAAISREFPGGTLTIPSGVQVELSINAPGGIPQNVSDTQISSIDLSLRGQSARADVQVLGEDITVLRISGGHISFPNGEVSLNYSVITEGFESLFRLFAVAATIQQGQGHRIRDDALNSRQPQVRALINSRVRSALQPMIRQLILDNRRAVPGLDLSRVLLGRQTGPSTEIEIELEPVSPQENEELQQRGIELPQVQGGGG